MQDDIFVEKPPKALSKSDTMSYFKGNSFYTREDIIKGNIRLVLSIVSKFDVSFEDKKDIAQMGMIGLMKAVDTFDVTKGFQFASYAGRCIENEILMYLRKSNKYINDVSLDDVVVENRSGYAIRVIDTIPDDKIHIIEDYEDKEAIWLLKQIVVSLNSRDTLILTLYFGLFGSKDLTQEEIAFRLNISRSYVSRLVNRNIKLLKELMAMPPEERRARRGKKGSSIFKLLRGHSKGVVYQVITELNEEDRILLHLRGGKDLDNPRPSRFWNKEAALKFSTKLMPKLRMLVEEKERELKYRQEYETLTPKEKYRRSKLNEIHNLLLNMDMVNAQVALHEYLVDTNLIKYETFIVNLIIISVMDKDFTFTIPMRNLVLLSKGYVFNIDKYKDYFYESLVSDVDEAPLYLDIVACLNRAGMGSVDIETLEKAYTRVLEKKK